MKNIPLLLKLFKLRNNLKKSRDEILSLQEEKLRDLLEHAYDNSAYYHKSFKEKGIEREDLRSIPLCAFPTIDKSILIDNFDEIVTTSDLKQEYLREFDIEESANHKKFKGKYNLIHSSGSTGKPAYFVYDDKAWSEMILAIIRGALWNMPTMSILKLISSSPRIVYVAATDGRYGGAMAVGSGVDSLYGKQLFIDIKTPLVGIIQSIKEFKPNIIIGYPSAIKILAELAEDEELQMDVLRVISCGEPLGVGARKYIEDVFKADVVNFYGASESLALGVETDISEGMYLFDDMNYVEIEDGVMYITSLYNYVQPLIRYKISDKLVIKNSNLNSTYPFTLVNSIQGRQEDLLWFENDEGDIDFLHPMAIEGFCIENLLDYQFKQISKNKFEITAQTSDKNRETFIKLELTHQLNIILKEKNLDYLEYSIRFVDKIMPNLKTGKKALVVKMEEELITV